MLSVDGGHSRISVKLFGECHASLDRSYLTNLPMGIFRIATYIILEGHGRPVLRRNIASLLWSERGAAQAGADIRQTIARVRRFQIEKDFRFIAADATMMWLVRDDDVHCDLIEFLDNLENPAPLASVRLSELYTGELLASLGSAGDAYEEWLSFQRTALQGQFLHAVSLAIAPDSGLSRQQRDFCSRRLLKVDPCHEAAYRALMRGAAESGQTSHVHQIFETCARNLREELGIRPGKETVQLFSAITQQDVVAGP